MYYVTTLNDLNKDASNYITGTKVLFFALWKINWDWAVILRQQLGDRKPLFHCIVSINNMAVHSYLFALGVEGLLDLVLTLVREPDAKETQQVAICRLDVNVSLNESLSTQQRQMSLSSTQRKVEHSLYKLSAQRH